MGDIHVSVRGQQLAVTNQRLDMLQADFSGLANLQEVMQKVVKQLLAEQVAAGSRGRIDSGELSVSDFDLQFSEAVRKELGATLGKLRNVAVRSARSAGAGSASGAIRRKTYRDRLGGNINIASGGRRLSGRKRVVEEPHGGESGIRRHRTVSARTKALREYYGPDRAMVLRWLDGGTDVRYAESNVAGRGSMATYGRRGNISARNFFHSLGSDMEEAAKQMGTSLVGWVENFVNTKFSE